MWMILAPGYYEADLRTKPIKCVIPPPGIIN
jgi:hypothetical protein